ncbi:MAG: CBS domain-containing protein [Candidatus Bathyarchaeia archaeon]
MLPELRDIEKRRRALGLTQKDLARYAGVSQSFIAKIESGRISPSYEKTKAIFDVLTSLERKREIKASEIMNDRIVGVSKDRPVSEAAKLMSETGYSQLPVFDDGNVVGSITEKTIINGMMRVKDPAELSQIRVEKIMDDAFPRIDESTPMDAISYLLQYSPAVLVTKKGKVVGIITKADLLKIFTG